MYPYEYFCVAGTFVRIAPNHLSIASLDAVQSVYGHSSGLLKSDYYDAFVSFGEGSIFSTRSRPAHARKRKIVAHMFAQRSIMGFEKRVKRHTATFVRRWDELCEFAKVPGASGNLGSCDWRAADERVWFDAMLCQRFGEIILLLKLCTNAFLNRVQFPRIRYHWQVI